jgi:hypothetical protein
VTRKTYLDQLTCGLVPETLVGSGKGELASPAVSWSERPAARKENDLSVMST